MHDPFGQAQVDLDDIFGDTRDPAKPTNEPDFFTQLTQGSNSGGGAQPQAQSNDMADFFSSM